MENIKTKTNRERLNRRQENVKNIRDIQYLTTAVNILESKIYLYIDCSS